MGRYGNLLLIGGQTDLTLTARAGEVLRLWLTNTANTRVFNVRLPGARMKLVGGDSGRVEREEFVSEVLLAPSERAVVDVLLDQPGELTLEHQTPNRTYPLAAITVTERARGTVAGRPVRGAAHRTGAGRRAAAARPLAGRGTGQDPGPGRRDGRPHCRAAGDRAGGLRLPDAPGGHQRPAGTLPGVRHETPRHGAAVSYACPMHPEVTSDQPGRCPQCGMKLLRGPVTQPPATHAMHQRCQRHARPWWRETPPRHGHEGMEHTRRRDLGCRRTSTQLDRHPDRPRARTADGIEWEDDMVDQPADHHRQHALEFLDRTAGATAAIDWRFTVGDRVKIRLVNEMDSDHPMHHPFHLHGAGRFLVLARDGAPEPNLVWKDTVLVRTGQTVDILFDVTNPGLWMAHCHIAEHMQSGMMFSFTVDRGAAR